MFFVTLLKKSKENEKKSKLYLGYCLAGVNVYSFLRVDGS